MSRALSRTSPAPRKTTSRCAGPRRVRPSRKGKRAHPCSRALSRACSLGCAVPPSDRPERRRGRVERERIEPVIGDAEPEREFEREREPAIVVDGSRPRPQAAAQARRRRETAAGHQAIRNLAPDLARSRHRRVRTAVAGIARPSRRRQRATTINEEALQQNARLLESVLEDFGIRGEIAKCGPARW